MTIHREKTEQPSYFDILVIWESTVNDWNLNPPTWIVNGSSHLENNGARRQDFTPMLTYLYLWASHSTIILAAHVTLLSWDRCKISLSHLTKLQNVNASIIVKVGDEPKLMRSFFKPSFFCLISALTGDISFLPHSDSISLTEVRSSPSLPFIPRHNAVIILTFLKVDISP